jgi:hypothetical protein
MEYPLFVKKSKERKRVPDAPWGQPRDRNENEDEQVLFS